MRLLLDTHTLAWWLLDSPRLSKRVSNAVKDIDNDIFVSAVSGYETAYKHFRGKWPEVGPLVAAFEEVVAAQGFELLPLSGRHAVRAGAYLAAHRDPFDRLLAAQAEVEGLTLATDDPLFTGFAMQTIW